jgi:glycosyltransferase involved in cell wall biosynthesis
LYDITFILPTYPFYPTGGYKVVYEYANNLVSRGYGVTVVHPRFLDNKIITKNSNDNILSNLNHLIETKSPNYHILSNLIYWKDKYVRSPKINWQIVNDKVKIIYVKKLLSKNIPKADIIFATAWETAEFVYKLPLSKGEKFYLIQGYEIWNNNEEQVNKTWKFPIKKVVISNWLYEIGINLGIPKNQIKHIPNGIDLTKFKIKENIENRPQKIAMLYHDDEWKGSKDGIEALQIAKKEHTNLRAILFGIISRPKYLPKWIDYIQNPPQDELVKDVYNGSSIYLCPSWTEGWHLPPAEAMACGCAVVSTNIGGVGDYAINGKTALLSPIKNADLLAKNLIKLLDYDDHRILLAKRGNSNIKNFTWNRATNSLVKFMDLY